MPAPSKNSTAPTPPPTPIDELGVVLDALASLEHRHQVQVLKAVMAFFNIGNVELTGVE